MATFVKEDLDDPVSVGALSAYMTMDPPSLRYDLPIPSVSVNKLDVCKNLPAIAYEHLTYSCNQGYLVRPDALPEVSSASGLPYELAIMSMMTAPMQVTLAQMWPNIDDTVKPELEERYAGIPFHFVIFMRSNRDTAGTLYSAPMWNFGTKIRASMIRHSRVGALGYLPPDPEVTQAHLRVRLAGATRDHFPAGYVWMARVVNGTKSTEGQAVLGGQHVDSHKIYWLRVGPMATHGKPVNAINATHGIPRASRFDERT